MIPPLDFAKRISAVQRSMADRGIDLMFLPRAANLFYLAGVRRQQEHGTDDNAYGDWLSGGYIHRDGPIRLVAPRMGGDYWIDEGADKPWISEVRLILEPEPPIDVLNDELNRAGLTGPGGRIAIDERSWSQLAIALRTLRPEAEIVNATDIITPMRMIKSAEELARMRRASDLTNQAFLFALERLKPDISTLDIEHEISYQLVRLGAEYTSFVTEVRFIQPRSDEDRALPRIEDRRLRPGDSISFDFGALVDGYASDFGRTAFCGEPPTEFVKANDAVLTAQAEAMKAMAAGRCTAAEANAIARRVIADAGFDDGFRHRLGHGIGITVHEPPFLDGVDQIVLQENMVFTVEPSIYNERFGTRIEDMVVVTEIGGVPMSNIERRLFIVG